MNATTMRSRYGREPVSAYIGEGWSLMPLAVGGVPFHRVGRYAITVGAPLGPEEDAAGATLAFRQHCRSKGWKPVIFQASSPVDGLRSHLIAREAFIDVADFSLGGSAMANARHSVFRARRDGMTVSWRRWSECDAETKAEMKLISESWRGGRPELTFTYGRLSDIPGDAWVGLAIAAVGRIEALSTWRPLPAGPGIVLDLMRRREDSTPGAVELMIVEAVELARSRGLDWLSLGSVCQSDDLPRWLRLVLASAAACGGSGLSSFKAKFRPRWENRYLALPARTAGPAGVAALAIAHVRGAKVRRQRAAIRLRRPVTRWAAAAGMTAGLCAYGLGAAATDIGWPATGPIHLALTSATDRIDQVPSPSQLRSNAGIIPAPALVPVPARAPAPFLPPVVTRSQTGGAPEPASVKSDGPDTRPSVAGRPAAAACAPTLASPAVAAPTRPVASRPGSATATATLNPGARCDTAVKQSPATPKPAATSARQAPPAPTPQATPPPAAKKPPTHAGREDDRRAMSQSAHNSKAGPSRP